MLVYQQYGKQEVSDQDLRAQIGKERGTFLQPKNIQNSKEMSPKIKDIILNSDFKTHILYRAET